MPETIAAHGVRRRVAAALTATTLTIGLASAATTPAGAIVNGETADQADHPWQVALTEETGEVFCGGTLVSADQIVTAAHCAEGLDPEDIVAQLGTGDLDSGAGQERRATEVISHPDYEDSGLADIAVIRLREPVELNDRVAPLALASKDDITAGKQATVAGWGVLAEEDESEVLELRQVDIPLIDDRRCATEMEADTDSELCAGGERAGSCYGDSGGPLVVRNDEGQPRLAGVVSWGDRCGDDNPEVYADVADLADWLTNEGDVDPSAAAVDTPSAFTSILRRLFG